MKTLCLLSTLVACLVASPGPAQVLYFDPTASLRQAEQNRQDMIQGWMDNAHQSDLEWQRQQGQRHQNFMNWMNQSQTPLFRSRDREQRRSQELEAGWWDRWIHQPTPPAVSDNPALDQALDRLDREQWRSTMRALEQDAHERRATRQGLAACATIWNNPAAAETCRKHQGQ